MPYVPNTPEDYDVDEATDRLLERYTPGSPVESVPRRQLHYVNHLGGTCDGLLSYNYTKKAKYALKLPERNEEILLPSAEAVGQVLSDSGREKISKWTVYDYFSANGTPGQRMQNKLQGATLRKLV